MFTMIVEDAEQGFDITITNSETGIAVTACDVDHLDVEGEDQDTLEYVYHDWYECAENGEPGFSIHNAN